jgi:membrane protein
MSKINRWGPTVKFLAQTETHVFALSIAASVLLSFFPFLIVMASLCRYTLHWPAAVDAINLALMDYFPSEVGAFVARNLSAAVYHTGPTQAISVLLLLFTANGVFEPLEVALNRVWGVAKNRSYLKNQVLSLGLILFCGALAMGSVLLTAKSPDLLRSLLSLDSLPPWFTWVFFKIAAVPMTVAALLFVYWVLPNRRVPVIPLIPVSIYVGLALEVLKYVFLVSGPFLIAKLQREYGPFYNSVAILLLSFLSSMVVLAGAEWSARRVE